MKNKNRPTPEGVANLLGDYGTRWFQDEESTVDSTKVVRFGAFVGSVIECHVQLDRAMDRARLLIGEAAAKRGSVASGTVILGDSMSGSKGRFTRTWHAPEGGLWGCMIHGNDLLPQSRQFIPMAVGVSCCEAIRELGVDCAVLRWVNDILIEGVKVAGFLVEGYTEPIQAEEFTLVGFGVNVNNCSFPQELDGLATSLRQYLKRDVDIKSFTECFLARLAWNFGLLYHEEAKYLGGDGYSGEKGRHMLLQRWIDLSDTIGREVVFGFDVMENPQYKARVLGVDGGGGLVLEMEDGHQKTEHSGEVRYVNPALCS